MDTDSNKDNTGTPSTGNALSFFCFIVTAYYVLKLFEPSQDAPMAEPSPGLPHMESQEILGTSDVNSDDQSENAGTEREGSQENYEVIRSERKESFGVEEGETDDLFLSESEEGRATDLSEQEEEEEEEEKEKKDKEEAESGSTRERSRILTADNTPTPAPSKKQRIIKPRKKPTPGLRKYDTNHYRLYNATTQNQGDAVLDPFRHFGPYDGYALYINPDLKDTELDQIPHSGVRVDDLTASKVLSHYNYSILRTRWPAEFDQKGMIRATRVPLGRAAKRWVNRGERDVDENLVVKEGWYYLSWGGIHTLMGKEGLDVDRYRVRPSFKNFKCPRLGFKRSDWAEVQLAPEDPTDPTFL